MVFIKVGLVDFSLYCTYMHVFLSPHLRYFEKRLHATEESYKEEIALLQLKLVEGALEDSLLKITDDGYLSLSGYKNKIHALQSCTNVMWIFTSLVSVLCRTVKLKRKRMFPLILFSWRNRRWDIHILNGSCCQLQLIHIKCNWLGGFFVFCASSRKCSTVWGFSWRKSTQWTFPICDPLWPFPLRKSCSRWGTNPVFN